MLSSPLGTISSGSYLNRTPGVGLVPNFVPKGC